MLATLGPREPAMSYLMAMVATCPNESARGIAQENAEIEMVPTACAVQQIKSDDREGLTMTCSQLRRARLERSRRRALSE